MAQAQMSLELEQTYAQKLLQLAEVPYMFLDTAARLQ
jgi:hypothetical protein